MKSLRIWIVLLLAVLLPVRGALAAGMHCSGAGSVAKTQVQHHEHHHEAASSDEMAAHGHGAAGGHDHGGVADSCNFCSASCSATALVSVPVTLPEILADTSVSTHPDARPPSFVPEGQERPPRTI